MKNITNLNWPARLALLNKYKPTDEVACTVLGIPQDELTTARELETNGTLLADESMDTESYAPLFSGDSIQNPKASPSLKSIVRDSGKGQPAQSATRKVSAPKKRGRKGNNIATAFAKIPSTPTPVDAFAATHGVSVAVLRQSKRFDKVGTGHVRVKKDKATASLMIWREANTTE